jgi:hypothetical protein
VLQVRPAETPRDFEFGQLGEKSASPRREIQQIEQGFFRRRYFGTARGLNLKAAEQLRRQAMERNHAQRAPNAPRATKRHRIDDCRYLFNETVVK